MHVIVSIPVDVWHAIITHVAFLIPLIILSHDSYRWDALDPDDDILARWLYKWYLWL